MDLDLDEYIKKLAQEQVHQRERRKEQRRKSIQVINDERRVRIGDRRAANSPDSVDEATEDR